MVDYFSYIKKAFKDILNNPAIIVPYLIGLCLGFLFILILIAEILAVMFANGITSSPFIITAIYNMITSSRFIITLIVLAFVDIILLILITSFIKAMLIGMYQEIATKGRTSANNMMRYAKENFKTCLAVAAYKAIIYLVPLCALIIVNVYVFFKISKIMTIATGIISLIIYAIYAAIFGFLFFFTDPIIATEKTNGFGVLKKSTRYAKEHFSHVMVTILMLFAVGIVIGLIVFILNLPQTIYDAVKTTMAISSGAVLIIMGVILFLNIIKFIVQFYMRLSTRLFIFYCYNAEKPVGKDSAMRISAKRPPKSTMAKMAKTKARKVNKKARK